jgi:CelD/BcsL family acetyltransferase involved in cellulose biosynthesis
MLQCELITAFSRLEALSPEWDRLWRRDPDGEIFQTFSWARAWWRTYGDRVSLCTIAVFEDSKVVGIIPLVQDGDRIVFLGGRHADYGDILCEEGRAVEIIAAAIEKLLDIPGWKECALDKLKTEGELLRGLKQLPRHLRRNVHARPSQACHTLPIAGNRTLDSLLAKNHTRRRLKKLTKAGTITFRHIEDKDEAKSQLREFYRHQRRRRALAGKDAPGIDFFTFENHLLDELDLKNELRFGTLEWNHRPLAWHVSFQVNNKLLFYQQTFDVDTWDYSPGEVLIHELLAYAKTNLCRELDFAQGDEAFKDRFTTHERQCCTLYIDPAGLRGRVRGRLRSVASSWTLVNQRIETLAKRNSDAFRRYRSVRLWVTGVVARMGHHQQNGGVARWSIRKLARLFRRKRQAKLRVYECDLDTKPSARTSSVREGRLGDLVEISLEHPEIIVPSELANYKRRLKQGDRVYLVEEDGKPVLIGWTTVRDSDDYLGRAAEPESGREKFIVLDECWAVPHLAKDLHCRELRCAISAEACKNCLTMAVRCPESTPCPELTCPEM